MPDIQDDSTINIVETFNWVRRVIVRRRWWILSVSPAIAFGALFVVCLLPNRYRSEATLLVVQQQVPERYVVPNSTTDLASALEAMKREVLSRPKLLKIVNDLNLYPDKRKRLAPDTVAELMLRDIEIQPLQDGPGQRDFSAFRISFIANSPLLAQRVTSTLTALFIDENLRTREEQSVTTTEFLHNQLEQKRQALDAQEKRLSALKVQFMGELPEQQDGNLGIMKGLQEQLQSTETALGHAQEQRVYLESLLNGYLSQANANLNELRAKRDKLLEVYTPKYGAVVKLDQEIARAERRIHALANDSPAGAESTDDGGNTVGAVNEPAAAQVRSQLSQNHLETENLSKEEARLKAEVAQYQDRLNLTPLREQQLLAVTRDVKQLQQEYAELGKKEQESQLATNLEKNQGGQQFRLADPPSLPATPASPKRLKMSLGTSAAALSIGVGFAFLMELKSAPLYTEAEVTQALGVPLVIGIPLLSTPAEQQRRLWANALAWVTGSVFMAVVAVAEYYLYRKG